MKMEVVDSTRQAADIGVEVQHILLAAVSALKQAPASLLLASENIIKFVSTS